MAENMKSIEQRIKENIKNYKFENLLLPDYLEAKLKNLSELTGAEFFVTDRHGERKVCVGDFEDFVPEVSAEPGEKIRVENRTIGHIYVKYDKVPKERLAVVKEAVRQDLFLIAAFGEELYLHKEYAFYADELEEQLDKEKRQTRHVEKEDLLTGVFNQVYFTNRMRVIDRSEVAPVALIYGNINDWKFVDDNFGEMESDRLISTVAMILKEEAKPEYIIGRCDGDVFEILIAMPEDGEAEDYCRRVQQRCREFDDALLAPSIAVGIVYKQNVEESLSALVSDAEYAMLENKLEMKSAPGYRERLCKAVKEK